MLGIVILAVAAKKWIFSPSKLCPRRVGGGEGSAGATAGQWALLPSVLCFGIWLLTLPLFLFWNIFPAASGAFWWVLGFSDDVGPSCPFLSSHSFSHLKMNLLKFCPDFPWSSQAQGFGRALWKVQMLSGALQWPSVSCFSQFRALHGPWGLLFLLYLDPCSCRGHTTPTCCYF